MDASAMRLLIALTLLLTVLFEAITIGARVRGNQSAEEWIEATNPSLLLRIHHMFWSIPFMVVALGIHRWHRTDVVLWSIALALIVSDLCHHFVVLPLWVGNTGWHWP